MDPLLTVIIPVYNGEKHIRRAVNSVLLQPYALAIDVLIINDGSNDKSSEICDQLSAENTNVRVIHKENGGVSSARNLGIESARGKYISFLDCDDWWEPDVFDHILAKQLHAKDSSDIYQFSYREVNHDITLEKRYLLHDQTHVYATSGLGRYDWSHHCSFFFLRKLFLDHEIRYLMCKVGEDGPIVEMALYHARSLTQSHKVLLSYWENYSSCVHTTKTLESLQEQCKGIECKKHYYEKINVRIDAETEKLWQILSVLPKLCALEPYRSVKLFMEETCMPILATRQDIRFGNYLWSRITAWKANPYHYWLLQRIKLGTILRIKNQLIKLPGIGKYINHYYSVHHRKFTPVDD